MARSQLTPYIPGVISVRQTATGYTARARYRDRHNKLREATAVAATKRKSEEILKAKIAKLAEQYEGGDGTLNHNTTVGKAAHEWVEASKRRRVKMKGGGTKPLSDNTIRQYEGDVKRYLTGSTLEHLTVTQANDVGRITEWLANIADNHGEAAAVSARKVLSGTLLLAEQREAIEISKMSRVPTPGAKEGTKGAGRMCRDADCDYDCGKRHSGVGRALTPDEWLKVAKAVEAEKLGLGAADVQDLTHFLFGTGARIQEALQRVDWDDIDWEARTVHVRGTKTPRADRVLQLSDELTKRLERRKEDLGDRAKGLVFGVTRYATKVGQPRDVSNTIRKITPVLAGVGLPWAGTHTFRRTVATWMDESGAGLAEIADQLGHANVTVTAGYLGRKTQPTRAAGVMVTPTR